LALPPHHETTVQGLSSGDAVPPAARASPAATPLLRRRAT